MRPALPLIASAGPTPLAWAVAIGAVLLGVVALNNEFNTYFGPRVAVLLVLAALGLPVLVLRAWRSALSWPARAAAAFLVVATVSAALSPAPWIGFFGVDGLGTGWLFLVCLAALWSLGTELGEPGAALLGRCLVLLALLNAGATVLEVGGQGWSVLGTVVAHFPGMRFARGQAPGFAPNPVFSAQLMAGGLALLAWRSDLRNRWPWWAMTAGLGAGAYLSGERFALLLVVALAVWVLVVRKWRAAVAYAAAAGGGVLVGAAFQKLVELGTSTQFRLVTTEGGNGAVGPRVREWVASLHAVAAHPLVGIGPSQSPVAVVHYRPVPSLLQDGLFPDAHNFVVEIAVTTGLLGIGLFLTWLVPAVRHARGALLLYSLVVLAGGLLEPLNITTTSLAFLALGAATVGAVGREPDPAAAAAARPGRGARPGQGTSHPPARIATVAARAVLVVAALVAGITVMVGNTELHDGLVGSDGPALAAAARHLPMWPDAPIALAGLLGTYARTQRSATYVEGAVSWDRVAVARDPVDATAWASLGFNEQELGHLKSANAALDRALALDPTLGPTYTTKALVLVRLDGTSAALAWARHERATGHVGAGFDPIISCLQQQDSRQVVRDQVAAACFSGR